MNDILILFQFILATYQNLVVKKIHASWKKKIRYKLFKPTLHTASYSQCKSKVHRIIFSFIALILHIINMYFSSFSLSLLFLTYCKPIFPSGNQDSFTLKTLTLLHSKNTNTIQLINQINNWVKLDKI